MQNAHIDIYVYTRAQLILVRNMIFILVRNSILPVVIETGKSSLVNKV